jgi:hypothetical protein
MATMTKTIISNWMFLQLLLDKPRECEWGKELHSYVAIISDDGKILFLLLDKPREKAKKEKNP